MNLNLIKLQIVELLYKHKKITTVASVLGLKQPTVTYHLKNLELQLGEKLFEPRMDKMILTESGRAFLHYAVKINALAAEAERVVKEFSLAGRSSLSIGASYVPATYILPGILSRFGELHPETTVSLSVKPSPVIKEMLVNQELDLGILSTESFYLPSLHSQPLCEDELVLVFAPGHDFAGYPELTPSLISEAKFIQHNSQSSTGRITSKWFEDCGFEPRAHLLLDSLEAIKHSLMSGRYVSFISRLAVADEVASGKLIMRPIPEYRCQRRIFYSYNRDRHLSPFIGLFIELMQNFCL
ncbi:transcriptional regulator [Paenibacillus sp. FSL R7-0273]|uniref:LysR family transcriptional regulator n=1 Tax=Paenibacillus sp. FSL R7-0273 TaxID=1536772 RepID=UPI0004F80207|nr:LysR family transcriptional regulator [Paenibacillus sp. FSL R7-0273]AIQ46315.1 transcriptional regulator [Paenibacillus sp. FSL R7-0273]OMF89428.1 transcriptional regulator [Paenibacillus sp. FSL R7-0273]